MLKWFHVLMPREERFFDMFEKHARTLVAGYKIPRELHVVDSVVRSPSGKPDYPWAKQLADSGDRRVEP